MKKIAIFLLFLTFLIGAVWGQGTDYTWVGGDGGDWHTAANWAPNGVPGINPDDEVTIATTSWSSPGMQITGDVIIKNITIVSNYEVFLYTNSNTLTVIDTTTLNGILRIAGPSSAMKINNLTVAETNNAGITGSNVTMGGAYVDMNPNSASNSIEIIVPPGTTTSKIGIIIAGSRPVTINIGDGSSVEFSDIDSNGNVTINIGDGSSVEFGDIDSNGNITINIGEDSDVDFGNITSGGTVDIDVGDGSTVTLESSDPPPSITGDGDVIDNTGSTDDKHLVFGSVVDTSGGTLLGVGVDYDYFILDGTPVTPGDDYLNVYILDAGNIGAASYSFTAPNGYIEIRGAYQTTGTLTLNSANGMRLNNATIALGTGNTFNIGLQRLTLIGDAVNSITATSITINGGIFGTNGDGNHLTLSGNLVGDAIGINGPVGTEELPIGDITVTTGAVNFGASGTVFANSYTQLAGTAAINAVQNYEGEFSFASATAGANTVVLTINEAITASGGFARTGTAANNRITANITTNNTPINISGAIVLDGDTIFTSNGGDITFNNVINSGNPAPPAPLTPTGAYSITIDAGAGNIDIKDIGTTNALTAVGSIRLIGNEIKTERLHSLGIVWITNEDEFYKQGDSRITALGGFVQDGNGDNKIVTASSNAMELGINVGNYQISFNTPIELEFTGTERRHFYFIGENINLKGLTSLGRTFVRNSGTFTSEGDINSLLGFTQGDEPATPGSVMFPGEGTTITSVEGSIEFRSVVSGSKLVFEARDEIRMAGNNQVSNVELHRTGTDPGNITYSSNIGAGEDLTFTATNSAITGGNITITETTGNIVVPFDEENITANIIETSGDINLSAVNGSITVNNTITTLLGAVSLSAVNGDITIASDITSNSLAMNAGAFGTVEIGSAGSITVSSTSQTHTDSDAVYINAANLTGTGAITLPNDSDGWVCAYLDEFTFEGAINNGKGIHFHARNRNLVYADEDPEIAGNYLFVSSLDDRIGDVPELSVTDGFNIYIYNVGTDSSPNDRSPKFETEDGSIIFESDYYSSGSLTFDGNVALTGNIIEITGDIDVDGTFTVGGTNSIIANDLTFGGNITGTGNLSLVSGTSVFNGALNYLNTLVIGTGAELNLNDNDFNIENLTITGTLNAGSGTIILTNGVWNRTGIFNAGTGTVEFNSATVNNDNVFNIVITEETVLFTGNNTVSVLTCNEDSTVLFANGSTQTIPVLNLDGAVLSAETPGEERWILEGNTTVNTNNLPAIGDCFSNNNLGLERGVDAIDNDNNINVFNDDIVCVWEGTESSDWDDEDNWLGWIVPSATAIIIIPVVNTGAHYPVLNDDVECAVLIISDGAELDLAGFNLTVTEENDLTNNGTIKLIGEASQTITMTPASTIGGTVEFYDSGTGFAGITTFNNLTIKGGDRTAPADITVTGTLEITGGILDIAVNGGTSSLGDVSMPSGSGTLILAGTETIEDSTLISGTVVINNSGAAGLCGITQFYNLTILEGTITAGNNVFVAENLIISDDAVLNGGNLLSLKNIEINGTLIAGEVVEVSGIWERGVGSTFTPGTGKVLFTNALIYNNNEFNNVELEGAVKFEEGMEQTVNGAFDISEASSIDSIDGATRWKIDIDQGSVIFDITPPLTIISNLESVNHLLLDAVTDATDGGNNRWVFKGGTFTWEGTESSDWDDDDNWVESVAPYSGDDSTVITIPAVTDPAVYPELVENIKAGTITIDLGAEIDLKGFKLEVAGANGLTNNGTIKLFGNAGQVTVGTPPAAPAAETGTIHYYNDTTGSTAQWVFGDTYNNLTVDSSVIMQVIESLTVKGTATIGSDITTDENQTYLDEFVLSANVELTTGDGFAVTLEIITGGYDLTITGNAVFNDVTAIGDLIVTGDSTINADIETTGDQTYTGDVTLGDNIELTVGADKTVTLGLIDGGGFALTITGDTVLNGSSDIENLTVTGDSTINANLTTNINQTYQGAISLSAVNIILSSTNGDIEIGGGITALNLIIKASNGDVILTGNGDIIVDDEKIEGECPGNIDDVVIYIEAETFDASAFNGNIFPGLAGVLCLNVFEFLPVDSIDRDSIVDGGRYHIHRRIPANRHLVFGTREPTSPVDLTGTDYYYINSGDISTDEEFVVTAGFNIYLVDVNTERDLTFITSGSGIIEIWGDYESTGTLTLISENNIVLRDADIDITGYFGSADTPLSLTLNIMDSPDSTSTIKADNIILGEITGSGHSLTLNGSVSFNDNIDEIETLTVTGTSMIDGEDLVFKGEDFIFDIIDGSGNSLKIEGDITFNGNISNIEKLEVDGNVILDDDLEFEGEEFVFGEITGGGYSLEITGIVTFHDDISGMGTLTVDGKVTLDGDIKTDFTFEGDGFVFSEIDGDDNSLKIDGNAELHIVSNIDELEITGDAEINLNITTTGDLIFGGDITLAGTTAITLSSASDIVITGDITCGAAETIGLILDSENGDISLSGSVSVLNLIMRAQSGDVILIGSGTIETSDEEILDECPSEISDISIYVEAINFNASGFDGEIIPGDYSVLCLNVIDYLPRPIDPDVIDSSRYHIHQKLPENKHLVYYTVTTLPDDLDTLIGGDIDSYFLLSSTAPIVDLAFTVSENFNIYLVNVDTNKSLTFTTSGSGVIEIWGEYKSTGTLTLVTENSVLLRDAEIDITGNFGSTGTSLALTLDAQDALVLISESTIKAANIYLGEITIASGDRSLTFEGNTVFNGNITGIDILTVDGDITLGDNLEFTGSEFILSVIDGNDNSLELTGEVTFSGNISNIVKLEVVGDVTLDGDDLVFEGDEFIFGEITGGGNSLTITGEVTFNDDISGMDTLTVTRKATLAGDIKTYFTFEGDEFIFSEIDGDEKSLKIDGNAELHIVENINVLEITGIAEINQSITTTGDQIYNQIVTAGSNPINLSSGGEIEITGEVSGIAGLTVAAEGNVTIGSGGVDLNNRLTLDSANGNININGPISAQNLIFKAHFGDVILTGSGDIVTEDIEILDECPTSIPEIVIYIEAEKFDASGFTGFIIPGSDSELCLNVVEFDFNVSIISGRYHIHQRIPKNKHLVFGTTPYPATLQIMIDLNSDLFFEIGSGVSTGEDYIVSENYNIYIVNADVTRELIFETSGSGVIEFWGDFKSTQTLTLVTDSSIKLVDAEIELTGTNSTFGRADAELTLAGTGSSSIIADTIILNKIEGNSESLILTGDVTFNGDIENIDELTVTGDVTLGGSGEAYAFTGTTFILGEIFGGGNSLILTGDVTFNGDIENIDELTVDGEVTLGGTGEDYTFTGTTFILGEIFGGDNSLTITGNTTFNGDINIVMLTVDGDVTLGGTGVDFEFTGTTVILGEIIGGDNSLKIDGDAELHIVNNIDVLEITGTAEINQNITTSGDQIYNQVVASGSNPINLSSGGEIEITGEVTGISGLTISAEGDLTIGAGGVDLNNRLTLDSANGNINISGSISAQNLIIKAHFGDVILTGSGNIETSDIEILGECPTSIPEIVIYIEAEKFDASGFTGNIIPGLDSELCFNVVEYDFDANIIIGRYHIHQRIPKNNHLVFGTKPYPLPLQAIIALNSDLFFEIDSDVSTEEYYIVSENYNIYIVNADVDRELIFETSGTGTIEFWGDFESTQTLTLVTDSSIKLVDAEIELTGTNSTFGRADADLTLAGTGDSSIIADTIILGEISGGDKSLTLTGDVTLNGDINDIDELTITGDVTLSGTGEDYAFTGTTFILGEIFGGGNSLTITGDAIFNGDIANIDELTVNGEVTLGGSGGDYTFTGTTFILGEIIGGGNSLEITGDTTFNGDISGIVMLEVVGDVTLNGAGTSRTFTGDEFIFSEIDGGAKSLTIIGDVTLKGEIENINELTINGSANIHADITTTGDQEYDNIIFVGSITHTLTSTSGDITLNGDVFAYQLAVITDIDSGNVTINGTVIIVDPSNQGIYCSEADVNYTIMVRAFNFILPSLVDEIINPGSGELCLWLGDDYNNDAFDGYVVNNAYHLHSINYSTNRNLVYYNSSNMPVDPRTIYTPGTDYVFIDADRSFSASFTVRDDKNIYLYHVGENNRDVIFNLEAGSSGIIEIIGDYKAANLTLNPGSSGIKLTDANIELTANFSTNGADLTIAGTNGNTIKAANITLNEVNSETTSSLTLEAASNININGEVDIEGSFITTTGIISGTAFTVNAGDITIGTGGINITGRAILEAGGNIDLRGDINALNLSLTANIISGNITIHDTVNNITLTNTFITPVPCQFAVDNGDNIIMFVKARNLAAADFTGNITLGSIMANCICLTVRTSTLDENRIIVGSICDHDDDSFVIPTDQNIVYGFEPDELLFPGYFIVDSSRSDLDLQLEIELDEGFHIIIIDIGTGNDANTREIIFTTSGAGYIEFRGDYTYTSTENITLNGNIIINGNVSITGGANVIQESGNLTLNTGSTLDISESSWHIGGAGTLNDFAGINGTLILGTGSNLIVNNLNLTGSGFTVNNTGRATISARGDVTITGASLQGGDHPLLILEMIGNGPANAQRTQTLTTTKALGSLHVRPGSLTQLANNLEVNGEVEIEYERTLAISNGVLDARGFNIILKAGLAETKYGDAGARVGRWTIINAPEEITAGLDPQMFAFLQNPADSVRFEKVSAADRAFFEISGNTVWQNFICQEQRGATIQFSTDPHQHVFLNDFIVRVTGSTNEADRITVTRMTETAGWVHVHTPGLIPPANGLPLAPVPAEADKFWNFNLMQINKLDIYYVQLYFSHAVYQSVTIETDTNNVRAFPFFAGNVGYFNFNWREERSLKIIYSFVEDSNGNGRVDRIRVQTSVTIDTVASNFTGFRAIVDSYSVINYSFVPGHDDSFYIYLEEKPVLYDGKPLTWHIDLNTSLVDVRNKPVGISDGRVYSTINTIPPRISYTVTLPGLNQTFIQMSQPVASYADGSGSNGRINGQAANGMDRTPRPVNALVYTGGDTPQSFSLRPGEPAIEGALNYLIITDSAPDITDLASLPPVGDAPGVMSFIMQGLWSLTERALDWSDLNIDPNSSYPPPKYPVDWTYSGYLEYRGNGHIVSMSDPAGNPNRNTNIFVPPYRVLTPEMMRMLESGTPVTPGMFTNDGELVRRSTDLLVSIPPAAGDIDKYFAWPVWARLADSPNPESDSQIDNGVIWDFDGSKFLEARGDIELQARINPNLSSPGTLELFWTRDVSIGFRNPAELPSRGSSGGLWQPDLSALNSSDPLYQYAPVSGINPLDPHSGLLLAPLFNFRLDSSTPLNSGDKIEFIFRMDSVPDMFIARLDAPRGADVSAAKWWTMIRPFSFDIQDIRLQRGGVTILNNVINSDNREITYLRYSLMRPGRVTIQVYTLDGTLVRSLKRNEMHEAGEFTDGWDGTNNGGRPVARGMYFIRVVGPDIDEIRKVMVVR
ncbi:MAG: hypothetical protein FWD22_00020 [Treponema sp.]|nr:hypothetical protein [Treponema sp.]